jgi:hypothetical protein
LASRNFVNCKVLLHIHAVIIFALVNLGRKAEVDRLVDETHEMVESFRSSNRDDHDASSSGRCVVTHTHTNLN